MNELLEVHGVKKRFDGLRAVDGVSLTVKEQSVVGLIGPNGSGKTTLFNIISGFYTPDSGVIYFRGRRIDGVKPHEIYQAGLIRTFQIPRPFYGLTVLDNVAIAARDQAGDKLRFALFRGRWSAQESRILKEARHLLRKFELEQQASMLPASLSGGQLKLLELVRTLISNPSMILLDEPSSGLSPVMSLRLYEEIKSLRLKGVTFLIIEHRLENLLAVADWVYVMHKGRIIGEGEPAEVVRLQEVIDAYLGET